MKKYINNRSYDTDTARACGSCEHGELTTFRWYRETLYQKKTGEFFLYGEGNAASPYARLCPDNSRTHGERITPMTFTDARMWAEENLENEEYDAIFGEIAEDDSRTTLTLSVASSTVERARRAAAAKGVSMSDYIESLINA